MPRCALALAAAAALALLPASATPVSGPEAELPVDTLPNLWDAASRASAAGRWPEAARLFEALEVHFAGEPAYLAAELRRALLPRRALARRASGDPAAAAADYGLLLAEFPADRERPWFQFLRAECLIAAGDARGAVDAALQLATDPAAGPAAPVGWLWAARQAQAAERTGELPAWLDALAAAPGAAGDLQAAGAALRLDAALLAEDPGLIATAVGQLPALASAPDPSAYDHLLDRATAALLAAGDFAPALTADRRRPEPALLASLLAQRRAWLATAASPAHPHPAEAVIHLARLQLAAPAARARAPSVDPDPALAARLLRRGHLWLRLQRPREAAATFHHVASESGYPASLRAEAAYRELVCWLEAGEAGRVLPAAQALARDHPDSPLVPDALFLAAEALTRMGLTAEALAALDELLLLHPDHASRFRWHYRRGRLRLASSDPRGGRTDFQTAAQLAPPGPFAAEAALQAAVAAVAAREFDTARGELLGLRDRLPTGHPVRPDVLHRLATVAYAEDDLNLALSTIEAFLAEAPGHAREAEARLLRGDLRLGLGEALAAVADYAQIPPEAGALHDHALFQTLRVYRALERDDLALRDLRRYLTRTDPPPGRRAEAVSSLAEILRRQGTPEIALAEAFNHLLPLLDDPAAAGVTGLLELVGRWVERIPAEQRPAPLAGGFTAWIEEARQQGRGAGASVRYARLTLAAARHHQRTDPVTAEGLLLELAGVLTPDQAGADALAAVGLQLLELEFPSARRWLGQLARAYPSHPDGVASQFAQAWLLEREDAGRAADTYASFAAAAPRHARTPEALLRVGRLRLELGEPGPATAAFEDVLRRREARGRPHAEAAAGLAAAAEAAGDSERALLLYQRVFTLHRAHADLATTAYLATARLLLARGDSAAAAATEAELHADPVLASATPGSLLPP